MKDVRDRRICIGVIDGLIRIRCGLETTGRMPGAEMVIAGTTGGFTTADG